MSMGKPILSFGCLLLPAALMAQVEQVLDLRHPGPGIGGILHDWGNDSVAGGRVRLLGDVDGDGRQEIGLSQIDRAGSRESSCIIVYGAPRPVLEGFPAVSESRRTRLVPDVEGLGILDFAPAGDLDRDGHGDFLLGLPNASAEGVELSGAAVLVFGTSGWPEEIPVSGLESSVRSLRVFSREASSQLGKRVSSSGDLNGDGNLDVAIAGGGEGTEDGLSGGRSMASSGTMALVSRARPRGLRALRSPSRPWKGYGMRGAHVFQSSCADARMKILDRRHPAPYFGA
jgi:hypothetical protein